MKIKNLLKISSIILMMSVFSSCGSDRGHTVSCFPEQHINVVLHLTLPKYKNDLEIKGWTEINEQQSGTRGLILVRSGIYPNYTFKVYDRNAPHICPETDTTLKVIDDIKIVCPKDGAEWILATGQPVKVSGLPPKTYGSSYNPSKEIITIYY